MKDNICNMVFSDGHFNGYLSLKEITLKHIQEDIEPGGINFGGHLTVDRSILIRYNSMIYDYVSKERFSYSNIPTILDEIKLYLKIFKRNYNINKLLDI